MEELYKFFKSYKSNLNVQTIKGLSKSLEELFQVVHAFSFRTSSEEPIKCLKTTKDL